MKRERERARGRERRERGRERGDIFVIYLPLCRFSTSSSYRDRTQTRYVTRRRNTKEARLREWRVGVPPYLLMRGVPRPAHTCAHTKICMSCGLFEERGNSGRAKGRATSSRGASGASVRRGIVASTPGLVAAAAAAAACLPSSCLRATGAGTTA